MLDQTEEEITSFTISYKAKVSLCDKNVEDQNEPFFKSFENFFGTKRSQEQDVQFFFSSKLLSLLIMRFCQRFLKRVLLFFLEREVEAHASIDIIKINQNWKMLLQYLWKMFLNTALGFTRHYE